jgi:hypothetical protein
MPEPSGCSVFGKTPWDNICAVETYVFGFCHGVRLLVCAVGEVCLRYDLVKFGEQVFVKLQNLGDVLLYG